LSVISAIVSLASGRLVRCYWSSDRWSLWRLSCWRQSFAPSGFSDCSCRVTTHISWLCRIFLCRKFVSLAAVWVLTTYIIGHTKGVYYVVMCLTTT